MGIQDNFWTIGDEAVAWGTKAATLTRGIENKADDATPNIEFMVSRGMRASTVGTPSGRSVGVDRGGSVTLTLDIMTKSLGLVFGGYAATVATTTPGGATNTRLHTFTPSTSGVTRSSTIHAGRAPIGGTVLEHNYLGCMGTELAISQQAKGIPELKAAYNYKAIDTAAAAVTPSYPASPYVYTDLDCEVTLNGTTLCQRQFDVTIPTGLDIARDRVCPGGREKPLLAQRVEPTGSLSIDYAVDTYHNNYLAGDEVDDLVFTWTGPLIEGSLYNSLTVTFPLIQFTGSSPKVSIDGLPEQPLPFRVLDNGTDPLWKIEYQNTDTTV